MGANSNLYDRHMLYNVTPDAITNFYDPTFPAASINVTDLLMNVLYNQYQVTQSPAPFDLPSCVNTSMLDQYIKSAVHNITTLSEKQRRDMEGDPLIYIVAVLFFYSCGIVVLMINYMKKEQHEFEENNLYKQYVDKRDRFDEYNNRGRSLNRLALQALNAVNVISQDDKSIRVAYV